MHAVCASLPGVIDRTDMLRLKNWWACDISGNTKVRNGRLRNWQTAELADRGTGRPPEPQEPAEPYRNREISRFPKLRALRNVRAFCIIQTFQ